MKRRFSFGSAAIGFCLAAVVLCGGIAVAADVAAVPSSSTVFVDGVSVPVEAFNIGGANYFKLRDFTAALDVGVWYDPLTKAVYIETDKSYDPDYAGPETDDTAPAPSPVNPGGDDAQGGKAVPSTVYITPYGERYHYLASCAGKNAEPVSIDEVGSRTPCGTCAK